MAKTYFNATKEQILKAAALAANAAIPAGLGYLHYKSEKVYGPEDMKRYLIEKKHLTGPSIETLDCDYVDGRCTKFKVWRPFGFAEEPKGFKFVTGYETQPTYETWFTKYPTYVELLKAAGITDWRVVGPR
jgi:hypothetical protein